MADKDNKFGWLKKALYNGENSTSEVEEPTVQKRPATQAPTPTFKKKITPVTPVVTETTNDDVELDESYINHLSDFMEKNNQPGPDYLEFAHSLDEMNSEMGDGVTEEKIFQMTYKVGYKQNLPIQKLLDTASLYITLFNQHKKEFDDFLDSESQKTVGTKVDENDRLTKSNSDALKKIEDLKKQINSLETNIETNNSKIEENSTVIDTETKKLQTKKAKFEKAFGFVVGKINDDIGKIKLYLKDIK